MSVRLQLVGKQMGGYRVHPMHAECIAGNGRFCTRRRALGAADRAERRLRWAGQRQLQAAIGALWQGGGWMGAYSGFSAGWEVGGWVGFAGFLAFLFRGSAKKLNPADKLCFFSASPGRRSRLLDRLTAAARRSGGAQRYLKPQGGGAWEARRRLADCAFSSSSSLLLLPPRLARLAS